LLVEEMDKFKMSIKRASKTSSASRPPTRSIDYRCKQSYRISS
jgi:hypothetical protein